jgi:hypothetical protein
MHIRRRNLKTDPVSLKIGKQGSLEPGQAAVKRGQVCAQGCHDLRRLLFQSFKHGALAWWCDTVHSCLRNLTVMYLHSSSAEPGSGSVQALERGGGEGKNREGTHTRTSSTNTINTVYTVLHAVF